MVRRAYALCRAHLAVIAYAVLVVALLVGLYRVETLARVNHGVLCDFKADIERRERTTREFREDIESGERPPIPGISVNDLARSESNLRQTLDSLSELRC